MNYYSAQFVEPHFFFLISHPHHNFSILLLNSFVALNLSGHGEIIWNISVSLCWAQRKWAAESVSFITPPPAVVESDQWAQISLEWTPGQHTHSYIHKYTESDTVNTHVVITCVCTHTSSTQCKHQWPCQHTHQDNTISPLLGVSHQIGLLSTTHLQLYLPPPCCHSNKSWRLLSVFCCTGSSRSAGPHRTAWRKSKSFVVSCI